MDGMTRNFNKKASDHEGSLVNKKVVVDPKKRGIFDETHNGSKFSSYDSFFVTGEHMDPNDVRIIDFKNPSGHRGQWKASDFVMS